MAPLFRLHLAMLLLFTVLAAGQISAGSASSVDGTTGGEAGETLALPERAHNRPSRAGKGQSVKWIPGDNAGVMRDSSVVSGVTKICASSLPCQLTGASRSPHRCLGTGTCERPAEQKVLGKAWLGQE